MRLLHASLLIVSFAALLPACSKQGVDVDKVKKDFTAEMDAISGTEGHKFLGYDGVDAVADGDKAKVTIKGLKLLLAGVEPLTFGDVEMHVVPKGEDQYEITDGKIPSKFSFKGPQGEFGVDIGSQSWSGVLSTKYHAFMSSDAKYGGIKVSGPALQGMAVDLAEITMKQTSDDKGNGVFDQTTTGTLKTLAITGPEGSGTFDGGEYRSEVKGAKLADLRAFGVDWQALVMTAGEGKPADPALLTRLKGYLGVIASMSSHADLAGLRVKSTATGDLFSAEHVIIDGSGTALDQPKGGFSFELSLVGLKVPAADLNPEVAKNKQFIPTLVKFGYALDNLPTKELWSAWLDMMGSGAMQPGNEEASQQMMQGLGMQLMMSAREAGSAFRLTNLELEAPAARLKMDGAIKADAAAQMGASGSANVEIGGLDAIADAARQSMPPEDAAGASGMFDMVRGFSKRETTDNKVVDRYAIVLAPDGNMTINDKPFDLFNAMMGQPQQ